MKKILKTTLLLAFMGCAVSCSNDDDTPNTGGDGDGMQNIQATYLVTFTPNFTDTAFPDDYPSNPMFSGMVLAVHGEDKAIFQPGTLASDALRVFAEEGESSDLVSDLRMSGDEDSVDFLVSTYPQSEGPTTAQSVTVTIDPDHTAISFVSSLLPSPDWFVGINTVSMIESTNSLYDELTVNVVAYDAGTDSGTTYDSSDMPTTPQDPIRLIESAPLGGGVGAVIGTLRFERNDL
ncbi:spondin domain-containing protein [Altibacter sp. HG106]|uniref:spondin domain-containing protein n=1 Tax=Altibacter sp. HG106 TaxID=3023937 RepID=UPI002350D5BD|nr:spondin domain-containing protein [Altibacter sp. HG106]MDC7994734.1 spondin domain-containing protein [Altibacter sp. HG106]